MNLENKQRKKTNDDYAENDFDQVSEIEQETTSKAVVNNFAKNSIKEDKIHRILEELEDLKSGVVAANMKKSVRPAAVPQQPTPVIVQTKENAKDGGDAIMTELTRLREENLRTQNAQEIRTQMTQLREELARELTLRGTNSKSSEAEANLMLEIRRLGDRLDNMERGRNQPYNGGANQNYPNAGNNGFNAQQTDYGTHQIYSMSNMDSSRVGNGRFNNALEEINEKLLHLDNQVSDLSALAVANDFAPITKDLSELKEKLSSLLEAKAQNAQTDDSVAFDVSDRLLDELVRLQLTIEDVKKSVDDLSALKLMPINPEPNGEVSASEIDSVRQTQATAELRRDMADGLNNLNEQIASLHADLKIYVEEGPYNFAPDAADTSAVQTNNDELKEKLVTLGKDIDFLTIHDSEVRPLIEAILDYVQDLHVYIGEKNLDEVTAKLDDIRNSIELINLQSSAVASDKTAFEERATEQPEPLESPLTKLQGSVESIVPSITQDLCAIRDMISANSQTEVVPATQNSEELQNIQLELTAVMAAVESLAEQMKPVDFAPIVNTIAAMKSDPVTMTEASGVDLSGVLEAISQLDGKVDLSPLEEVKAQLSANKTDLELIFDTLSDLKSRQMDVSPLTEAIQRVENMQASATLNNLAVDFNEQPAAAVPSEAKIDLAPINDALARLEYNRTDIAPLYEVLARIEGNKPDLTPIRDALARLENANQDLKPLTETLTRLENKTDFAPVYNAIARLESKLDAIRQAQATAAGYQQQQPAQTLPVREPTLDFSPVFEAITRLDAKLDTVRQAQMNQRSMPSNNGIDGVVFNDAVARLESKLETIRQKQSLPPVQSDNFGAYADSVARLDAKLDSMRQSMTSQNYSTGSADVRGLSDSMARVENKLDMLMRKLDNVRPTDNNEILNAVSSIRSMPNNNQSVLDAIASLRRDVSALAVSRNYAPTMPTSNAAVTDLQTMRRMVREEMEAAERARPTRRITANHDRESAAVVDRAVTDSPIIVKPVAIQKETVVKPRKKTTEKKKTATTAKASTAKKTATKKSVTKTTVKKDAGKTVPTTLTVADTIAKQISYKLLLEQLMIEPLVSKTRKKKMLDRVREGEGDAVKLRATSESIRQHANQLVIDRMLIDAGTQEQDN